MKTESRKLGWRFSFLQVIGIELAPPRFREGEISRPIKETYGCFRPGECERQWVGKEAGMFLLTERQFVVYYDRAIDVGSR